MLFNRIGYFLASIWFLQLDATTATPLEISQRIVGGTEADLGDVPYLVQIRLGNTFICGGSLFKSNVVVSAAHCFDGVQTNRITVVAGTTRIHDTGVRSKVKSIKIGQNFTMRGMKNDVAVLKLEKPLTGKNIATIGLYKGELKPGMVMKVSGWGKLNEDYNEVSDKLMTVNVPIYEKEKCKVQYEKLLKLTDSMFCASQPGEKDACTGDSGGPGVINNKLCAIVSFGIGCARWNYSGVYTSIPAVTKFIEDNM